MTDDQKTTVIEYAQTLNSNIPTDETDALLVFTVDEVTDRVLLYLNTDTIADNLLRIIANLVVSAYNKADSTHDATSTESGVSIVKDQGQTVHFGGYKQYFATASDDELMDGFTGLLKRYRRVQVVGQ